MSLRYSVVAAERASKSNAVTTYHWRQVVGSNDQPSFSSQPAPNPAASAGSALHPEHLDLEMELRVGKDAPRGEPVLSAVGGRRE